jgi:hypothetical protein
MHHLNLIQQKNSIKFNISKKTESLFYSACSLVSFCLLLDLISMIFSNVAFTPSPPPLYRRCGLACMHLIGEVSRDPNRRRPWVSSTQSSLIFSMYVPVFNSVADPNPGSGAFFTPGSGIRDGLKVRIRIWDPGWVKCKDPDPGSTTRIIFPRA